MTALGTVGPENEYRALPFTGWTLGIMKQITVYLVLGTERTTFGKGE